jgi:type I restriction enzyme, S subunit
VNELPPGWVAADISTVTLNVTDGTHVPPPDESYGIPLLSAKNITDEIQLHHGLRFVSQEYFQAEVKRTGLAAGDVLLTIVGSIGRSAIVPPKPQFALQRSVAILKPSGVSPKFLSFYLRSPRAGEYFAQHARGTAQVGLYLRDLKQLPVPVAPWNEQERIVALIEEQFSRLDAGVAALKRARENLKRMRRSLLADACSGRLTAQWRVGNQGSQSGSSLLEDLLAAHTKIVRRKAKGCIPPDPRVIPDLPATWAHASVDQVCSFVTDGEHLTPPRTSHGVMLLSARNVQNGFLVYGVVDHISEETYQALARRLEVRHGDVLLSCSGSVGRSAVVPHGARFALVRSVAVLRPLLDMGRFISLMLRSPQLQAQINTRKTQTAQSNIFQGEIRALTLPLPPHDEQSVIVSELERKLALLDDLEKTLDREELRFGTLRASILAIAFSGKLVPQDPNDEPAAVLLDRITAERTSSNGHRSRKIGPPGLLREGAPA